MKNAGHVRESPQMADHACKIGAIHGQSYFRMEGVKHAEIISSQFLLGQFVAQSVSTLNAIEIRGSQERGFARPASPAREYQPTESTANKIHALLILF